MSESDVSQSDGLAGARAAAVIYNPVKVDIRVLRTVVAEEERLSGYGPTAWFQTTPDDAGGKVTRQALAAGPVVVIVAGGDGTVRAVAAEVQSSGIPLAVVPVGTGNLLARNLRLKLSDVRDAIHTAFTGSDRHIDVGFAELERADRSISKHAFLVMAGIGLDANMAVNTSSVLKKRVGWLAYVHPIALSVIRNRQLSMRYRIDESHVRSIRAHTVIVGNCGTLTANMLLLPDAVIDDGLLDVVVLRPKGVGGWARIGTRLAVGGVLHRSKGGRLMLQAAPTFQALQYVQARELVVRFEAPEAIELDGDSFGDVVAAKITILHRSLIVRVAGKRAVNSASGRS
jgi:diacylglycerol kinase (ATP)